MIKVLLAEDHTIVRKGILSILSAENEIEVIGEAENGREAVQMVEKLHPDVVVMDISMPILNGLEATRQIKKRFPKMKILILSMHTAEDYVFEILDAGAAGYILKKDAPSELISAIQAAERGDKYLSPSISHVVVNGYLSERKSKPKKEKKDILTSREKEVLQLIAEGHTNRQIAEKLYISIKTVETHRTHIMDKLDIHTAAELTQYALRKGIIQSE
jgi:two-component system response regulator NreC